MRNKGLLLITFVMLGSLLAAGGCATTGIYDSRGSRVNYDKFHDSHGENKIVSKNNDLYLEKIYGEGESRRLTHTPAIKEREASFVKDGEYITYIEEGGRDFWSGGTKIRGCYIMPSGGDDSKRKTISLEELIRLK